MIPFQYAGIFVCLLLAGWGLRSWVRHQVPGWLSLLAILLGAAGAVTIFDPDLTTALARQLGIDRGADLLTYMVALAFIASWFYFYQRLRTLSKAVTVLTRELAMRDPKGENHADGGL